MICAKRLLPVPHHRGNGCRDVVVDRAHRCVDQRVDQLALALLEFADDDHAHGRIQQAAPGVLEPPTQVGSLPRTRQTDPPFNKLDQI